MGKIVSVRCGNLTAVARHGDKITLTKPRVFSGAVWSVRCATSVRLPSQRASPAKHLGFFRFRPGFDRQSASANGPAWAALRKHRMISSDTKSALCGPRREWRSVATTQNLQVNLTKRLTHVTGAG